MLATIGINIALLLTIIIVVPDHVPRALGVQDVFVGSTWLPVLPLGFVTVAVVVPLVSVWAARKK